MKKNLRLIFTVLICCFLTGCYGTVINVDINSNGSGSFEAKIGISEKAYQMMESLNGGEDTSQLLDEELEKFVYNGRVYYGEVENLTFSNIEEFNSKLINVNEDSEIDSGLFKMSKNEDGTFMLEFSITNETANTSEMQANAMSLDISKEQTKSLMKDMVMLFTFNMPDKVVQIEGDNNGITIDNNRLQINYLKLEIPTEKDLTKKYVFKTEKELKQEEQNTSRFIDVPVTRWSCKVINILAEGGLVSGVGEGRFSPERGMRISEFCQLLANATGLESGADENGYWAAKAIKNCIDKGYIYTHGEINSQIYDEVITREEAIAAMQIASQRAPIVGNNMTIQNIPDGDQISDKYKNLIVQAYNSGITTGVDNQFRFSPKNELTREEVCQLFYNVNWTTRIKQSEENT